MAHVESKCIPHELPSSHWLKATGQCVLERYLSATMMLVVVVVVVSKSLLCWENLVKRVKPETVCKIYPQQNKML